MNAPTATVDSVLEAISGFEVECQLAQGGMATVYLARQSSLNRKVALKVLRAFNNPEHKTRFFNESRIIASLNHRNIVRIHDVSEHDALAVLSMEYYEGGDLTSRIAKGPIDPCTALEITASIADSLAFAHQHGIVHRDVKPANILFHQDGTPILTDFGIASDSTVDEKLTAIDTALGTPCYVSPEQVQGESTDGRSDIYSLGVVLYEMLVGHPPFSEASAIETMAAHVTLPAPQLPEGLDAVQALLDQMLAKNPDNRFRDAGEVADTVRSLQIGLVGVDSQQGSALTRWLDDFLVLVHQLLELAQRGCNDRRVVAGAIAVGMVLAAWILVNVFVGPDPVDEYLDRAEIAVDEDRLAYPLEGSALFYLREVLALDPQNDDAAESLHEIAEVYADRAESDLVQ